MNEIEKAQQEITEARNKLASAEARLSALSKPVEREYRAGEWGPDKWKSYYYIGPFGIIGNTINAGHESDVKERLKFPNRAIAEAAKAHADWWREFDMSDEGGDFEICVRGSECFMEWAGPAYYGNPRYQPKAILPKVMERLGGEQKVVEMLNKGREVKP